MEKTGLNFNFEGDFINHGQSQFGGSQNTQKVYLNHHINNPKIEELKNLLEEFEDVSTSNKEWQDNFTKSLTELYRLEEAKDEIEEKKSVNKLKKFFNKAKEVKDWVAIGVLPAELATKGKKMIELGESLFNFVKPLI
jgi:hypothetical protein